MKASLRFAEPPASDADAVTARSRVPILVVDDNAGKRLALKAVLLPLGYSVVEADSGEAALRCVMAQDFAVILLDVRMPIMDGFETASLIRLRRQSEMTPIILVTAHDTDDIVNDNRSAQSGGDFIFAPVPPEELRAIVSVFANLFLKAEGLASERRELQKFADERRLLAEAAPIGIFQTDADNCYVYTNPRWSEITGIAPDAALGRPWETILSSRQRAGLIAEIGMGALQRQELTHRFEIEEPSSAWGSAARIALVMLKAVPDNDGGVAGWVGTLADVTAEVGAEAAMAEARDQANEASRLKSDFLANMSHELRTPMNGVIGMTDLLLETDLDPRQRDYAQTVRNSGEALLTIISDILDFSKVEAGKLDIEDIKFDVQRIVEDVVALLGGPAQTKGLELIAVLENSLPAAVSGDPGRVRQVLINLIGNAIKFTQGGEIVVRVTAAESTGAGSLIRFEVTDTGAGIAPDKLVPIFQPFVQADTSTSREYGGTGLGLAISSQLVALMGGECGVSSTLGTGSTFWFTIPMHAQAAPAGRNSFSPDAGLAGARILVVDDNATQRGALSGCLTDWGMDVGTADSGQAALHALRSATSDGQPFAGVLVDWSMAGMDGLELGQAIAVDPALDVRLVLMNDLGAAQDTDGAAAAGVCASLTKPVRREDLRASLYVALGLRATEGAPVTSVEPSPAPPPTGKGRLLLAEDNLVNQKVAVAMLSAGGYGVDTVRNGASAVKAAGSQPYGAILMDCQMPGLSGYEATAAIRAQEGPGRHTPIIAVTAGARREDRERCLAEGMDDYLAKPVSKQALLAVVARFVQSQTAFATDVDNDTAFFAELVDTFVHETETHLIELRRAVEAGDTVAVGRLAHTMMGSGAQMGGQRLASACRRLEDRAHAGAESEGEGDLQDIEAGYQELRGALMAGLSSVDAPTSPEPASVPSKRAALRILVADDDPTFRLIIQRAVRSFGHECHTALDGTQAWEALRSERFDVVISDWMMPGLNGVQLCGKVRAELGHYTYFIMVTGQGALDYLAEGMGAGANDYLFKPLDTDDLRARLLSAARVMSLHG
jgi:two-component system sensor histidine kinase/response regulator